MFGCMGSISNCIDVTLQDPFWFINGNDDNDNYAVKDVHGIYDWVGIFHTGDDTYMGTKEQEGYWRIIFQVNWDTESYRRQFFIKYEVTQLAMSAFPLLSPQDFGGQVLESSPPTLAPSQTVTPFVSDVSPGGLITLGFPEAMSTSEEEFADPTQTAIRKLNARLTLVNESG